MMQRFCQWKDIVESFTQYIDRIKILFCFELYNIELIFAKTNSNSIWQTIHFNDF